MKISPFMKKTFFLILSAAAISVSVASAEDYDILTGGNWSTTTTWTPNSGVGGPGSGDTLTIDSLDASRIVTLDVNPTITSLSFDNDSFNATFTPSSNRLFTISGDLTKAGTASLIFRSTNSGLFSGTIGGNLTVSEGLLALGQAGDNNTATSIIVSGSVEVASGATLGVRSTTQSYGATTLSGTMVFYGNNGATATFGGLSGSGVLSGTSSNAQVRTVQLNKASGTSSFSGNITELAASSMIKITKQNNYTQTLSGSSNYTGQTLVSAGTLLVSGTHIDGVANVAASANSGYNTTSTGHYQVASGATLGGSGYIAGNTTVANTNMILVQNNGILAPGASIGALTLDGANISDDATVLRMASGAIFQFKLAGNGGTPDQINFWNYAAGDFLLNSNSINLTLSGPLVAGTYTVSLFRFFTGAGTSPGGNDITTGLSVGTLGSGITTDLDPFTYDSDSIDITYTVIPEPGTCVLLLAGLGAVFGLRRSRRLG